jgi:hypothetical protein
VYRVFRLAAIVPRRKQGAIHAPSGQIGNTTSSLPGQDLAPQKSLGFTGRISLPRDDAETAEAQGGWQWRIRAMRGRPACGPLRSPKFRNLLIADVVSDVGTFMQSVGAAWLMVSLNAGPMYVALTQTASALPFFILALPAGAIGDIVDRRRLILFTEIWMVVVAVVLAVMTIAGRISRGPSCPNLFEKRTCRLPQRSTASNSISRGQSDRH